MATTTSRRRLVIWGISLVILVGALAVALRPRPVPVDIAQVTAGPLAETLDHEGRTRVRKRFVVSAPVPGRVRRIDLRPGDRVVANQTVVATFAPADAPLLDPRSRAEAVSRVGASEALLAQARAQRDEARVQSEHALEQLKRATDLRRYGLMTTEQAQAAEAEAQARQRALDAADAAVRAAQHDLDAVRAALIEPGSRQGHAADGAATLVLRSPIDGVVLERHHESEAVVAQGEPLVTVADTASLEVAADFLSTDAVRIRPGMRALVDQWGGDRPLDAVVRQVEPSGFVKVSALGVEEQRVWVVLDFAGHQAAVDTLGDGFRVEARVIAWESASAVRVPISAIFRRGDGWAVFVDRGGRAVEQVVSIGHRNGTFAEVLSGLSAGDRVVVYPPDGLASGARIVGR